MFCRCLPSCKPGDAAIDRLAALKAFLSRLGTGQPKIEGSEDLLTRAWRMGPARTSVQRWSGLTASHCTY
jgi:hypothetical protein